jgi:hypothetical protein
MPRISVAQTSCARCGASFSGPPAWAAPQPPQPQQPQGWQQQPFQPPQQQPGWQQPVQPQGWQQQPQAYQQLGAPPAGYQTPGGQQPGFAQQPGFGQQPGYAPGYGPQPGYAPGYGPQPGYAPGYAPAKKPPIALIVGIGGGIGALLIVVLLAVFLLAGHSSSGGITFSPANITCGQTVNFSETIRLPASVHSGDTLKVYEDGVFESNITIDSSSWVKQNDGSWSLVEAGAVNATCTSSGWMSAGHHTMAIKDSNGKTLAEGSYTVSH